MSKWNNVAVVDTGFWGPSGSIMVTLALINLVNSLWQPNVAFGGLRSVYFLTSSFVHFITLSGKFQKFQVKCFVFFCNRHPNQTLLVQKHHQPLMLAHGVVCEGQRGVKWWHLDLLLIQSARFCFPPQSIYCYLFSWILFFFSWYAVIPANQPPDFDRSLHNYSF